MKEYHKIQSIFKRDEKTHRFIEGKWSLPEFEYLKDNLWLWTEKIDGTNVRIDWIPAKLSTIIPNPGHKLIFGGRTTNAQMPTFLLKKLQEMFTVEKFNELYPETAMTLYGEGYGARIQKGGGNYIKDGVDFMLFDVMIDNWWLKRKGIEDIASKLGIGIVPILFASSIDYAIKMIKKGQMSMFGLFLAEGVVGKPRVELKDRAGRRIVTKLKHKDFLNAKSLYSKEKEK